MGQNRYGALRCGAECVAGRWPQIEALCPSIRTGRLVTVYQQLLCPILCFAADESPMIL